MALFASSVKVQKGYLMGGKKTIVTHHGRRKLDGESALKVLQLKGAKRNRKAYTKEEEEEEGKLFICHLFLSRKRVTRLGRRKMLKALCPLFKEFFLRSEEESP